jgi:hypothetical protein
MLKIENGGIWTRSCRNGHSETKPFSPPETWEFTDQFWIEGQEWVTLNGSTMLQPSSLGAMLQMCRTFANWVGNHSLNISRAVTVMTCETSISECGAFRRDREGDHSTSCKATWRSSATKWGNRKVDALCAKPIDPAWLRKRCRSEIIRGLSPEKFEKLHKWPGPRKSHGSIMISEWLSSQNLLIQWAR